MNTTMKVTATEIKDVLVIEPDVHEDNRGYFYESYNQNEFDRLAGKVRFVQDNQSYSRYGVIRGLHYQLPPHAQSKLVRVVTGRILDVAVDIRKGSPTYGRHAAVELSAENRRQLFIPRGFAHGFSVLSAEALVLYKCDDFYAPQAARCISWNDPALGIDWKTAPGEPLLSEQDSRNPALRDSEIPFNYFETIY